MSIAQAPEREFRFYSRGDVREEILTSYRVHLRKLVNPDTGQPFTETEIATATAEHSLPWIRADAIDVVLLAKQNNAMFVADQIRVRRAGTSWLETYHGPMWVGGKLPAAGGSGPATQSAAPGTIFVGSTTLPDPSAYACTAPDGKRFQLLFTVTTPGAGVATLTFQGVDTGGETNLETGVELTPSQNIPPGSTGKATVTANFSGGVEDESDADYAERIESEIRHKAACGNSAHIRAWARQASSAVEDAFVYPCALHAGSVVVTVTQKRGTSSGPYARIPSVGTLAAVIAYLTPPASPVMPARPFLLALPPRTSVKDVVVEMAMVTGQAGGWTDFTPWPAPTGTATATTISNLTDQQHFRISIPASSPDPPSGVAAPALMVWNATTSRFERLNVQSYSKFGAGLFDIVLSSAPVKTLATGDYVSPDSGQRASIAAAVETYFDSLGPGEVVASTDSRFHRAARFPLTSEEWPTRFGDAISTYLLDALGSALSDVQLITAGSTPAIPSNPAAGAYMAFLGKLCVYPIP